MTEALRTDWPAHCTTNAQAARAREIGAARREVERDIATRHGRSPQYLKPDGLQQLYDAHLLGSDHFRAGQRYQKAYRRRKGSIRSSLNMDPPGDAADAIDGTVDAGRIVSKYEALCADPDPRVAAAQLKALRMVCGEGWTARQIDGHTKRVVSRLVKVLDAAIEARA